VVPAAVAGLVFYLLAGVGHLLRPGRSRNENIAMLSDLALAAVLAIYLLAAWLGWTVPAATPVSG